MLGRRFRTRRWVLPLFVGSFVWCLLTGQISAWSQSAPRVDNLVAPSLPLEEQVQEGVNRYRNADYRGAIALWEQALYAYEPDISLNNQVIVLENLALAHGQLGENEQALNRWTQLADLHRQQQDWRNLGRVLVEQAQTYSSMGQPRNAIALLCNEPQTAPELACVPGSAVALARGIGDVTLEAAALGSLGNVYRSVGEYDRAVSLALQPSLELAQQLNQVNYQIAALTGLGHAYRSLADLSFRRAEFATQRGANNAATELRSEGAQRDAIALEYFLQGQALAQQQNDGIAEVRSLLGAIPIYARMEASEEADAAFQRASDRLTQLPENRERVYMTLELAQLLQSDLDNGTLTRFQCSAAATQPQRERLLQQAADIAQRLQDPRSSSFALGELGHVYECRGDLAQATDLTQQARWFADQNLQARDSLYLWEWQSGRILKAQGQSSEAIKRYGQAIATLETIRGDILTAARDVQFDFRDTVEPIYRELVALKLAQETPSDVPEATLQAENLNVILKTIDSLKLAELQNYFGDDCIIAPVAQENLTDPRDVATAVVNTFILDDQTAVIVSFPEGEAQFAWINAPRSEILDQVNRFRAALEINVGRRDFDAAPGRQLYDWLIRPFANSLKDAQIQTLVFVQDGIFRSAPMAALQDGDRFLIEDYAIATTPSLSLTGARVMSKDDLRVLALGLTQSVTVDNRAFAPLFFTEAEVNNVAETLPDSKTLLDQEFTRDRLQTELSRTVYPILHIATHGVFGAEPEDTFILTGDGQKLTFTELDRLIRRVTRNPEPLELLALTACETAAGDDRAALGLAGVAVQAGAKSALASLWQIDDAATAELATQFYTYLREPGVGRAEALRSAQLSQLETMPDARQRPGLWSALVLVGNWQ